MRWTSELLNFLVSRFYRGPSRDEVAQEVEEQKRRIEERARKRGLPTAGARVWGGEREEGEDGE